MRLLLASAVAANLWAGILKAEAKIKDLKPFRSFGVSQLA